MQIGDRKGNYILWTDREWKLKWLRIDYIYNKKSWQKMTKTS